MPTKPAMIRYKGHRVACAVCGRPFNAKGPRARYCKPRCQQVGLERRIDVQATRRTFLMTVGLGYQGQPLTPKRGKNGEPPTIPLGMSEAGWAIVSDPKRTPKEKWDALSEEDRRRVIENLERAKVDVEKAIRSMKDSPESA